MTILEAVQQLQKQVAELERQAKQLTTAAKLAPRDAVALLLGEINDKDEDCIVEEPEPQGGDEKVGE